MRIAKVIRQFKKEMKGGRERGKGGASREKQGN
jgi:hypothetical protein